ncbi:DUF302 domain-containing protein [Maritimibacter sp. HL-12]|uniref:DUF302 domain-containing protein n=1 Tax=Maritimibacter sp. HL-12 TaxID=1162418 RepID=UPI000A0F2035|nr:DUF302 domain-containing protein [Maritimibacter sp. HL-12]SMH51184.1 hypothetical protein SAMN05661107_2454 [Maritimibacter sp. HL-12]
MRRAMMLGPATALVLSAGAVGADEMFVTHELNMGRAEAVAALRTHVEAEEDWLFLAEFGLAGDKVTALKICYLPLGPDVVEAGLHVMAMMPCGNFAFYEAEDGRPEMSMLDPGFMTVLSDAPSLQTAVEKGRPAFETLLSDALGID